MFGKNWSAKHTQTPTFSQAAARFDCLPHGQRFIYLAAQAINRCKRPAIVIEKNGQGCLYFVVETKSGLFQDDMRDKEKAKIVCEQEHFIPIAGGDNPAQYM